MAASTVSNIPPLSDRSNTLLDASVPPHCSPTPSRHLDSKRHLFPYLDSSEATPSENGSVYDAPHADSESEAGEPPRKRPRSRSRSHSRTLSGEQCPPPGGPNGPGVAVRFINRPDATPLTTIIEQKSIATLRSAKSLAAVARPITSKHANRCADGAEQKQIRRDHADRRQAALTVDEATLRELHEIIDSQVPAAQRVCSGSASECVNDVENPTHPISPPLPPLFRAQTPCGLPRWPGDLPTSFHLPPRRASRARSFGNALRDFFRGPREEVEGRNHSSQTAIGGLREVQERLQQPHANPSNHRTGLAFWAPLTSGHGTSNLPACHNLETESHEVTAETSRPCDPPAMEHEPGTRSRPHGRNEKRDQDSTQREPLQPQDRQGPVQAPLSGSAPPNVAQAVHGQASRCPSTSHGHRQERLPANHAARADSPTSTYSSPTRTGRQSTHPLIPAPLFTSPPHSRRDLDPRVPVSPYDRLAHVLNSGQPPSPETPSRGQRRRDRDDTTSRHLADEIPVYRRGVASLRSLDTNRVQARRIVLTASSTPASVCASSAAGSSQNPHVHSVSTHTSYSRRSPPASLSSIAPNSPLISRPESQPQTKHPQPCSDQHASPSSASLTVIRSAALPILLPIAAAEGIVRPRPLPRPVNLPLTDFQLNHPPRVSRQRRPSSSASARASIRAFKGLNVNCDGTHSGSSDSFHTATQTPPPEETRAFSSSGTSLAAIAPLSLDQVVAADTAAPVPAPRGPGPDRKSDRRSNDSSTCEKSVGETLGWLLRVCFCQPVGGVEDCDGGDDALDHHGGQPRRGQGLNVRVEPGHSAEA